MTKAFTSCLLMIFISIFLIGCGDRVEVPPAHVGKILTKDGFRPDTIKSSKFRLDACLFYCDKLVLLSDADEAVTEKMTLFIPKDKLEMTFEIKLTLAIQTEKHNEIFTKVSQEYTDNENVAYISRTTIYKTYAEPIIRTLIMDVLSQYDIAQIASSRDVINIKLQEVLSKEIKERTPFLLKFAAIDNLAYPKIIIEAQKNAAARREAIEREEAELQVSKIQLERAFQEQQLQRKVEVEKANSDAEVARIQADSMTPAYVQYRTLEIMNKIAESPNKTFVPLGALDSIATQMAIGDSLK